MPKTKLVGILNVTPDSFSDGNKYADPESALAAASRMFEEGAEVVDIGAESTRPGAVPVTPQEEWARLQPVVEKLPRGGIFSLDTRHVETVRRAVSLNMGWINDVAGFTSRAMIEAVKDCECKLVFMHSLGIPADPGNVLPESADIIALLLKFAQERIAAFKRMGVTQDRLIFDPGIGFGKTPAQSWEIIRHAKNLKALGIPIMIGHSRKSFLGDGDRDESTLAVSYFLARQGVDYLRVHDVAGNRRILQKQHHG